VARATSPANLKEEETTGSAVQERPFRAALRDFRLNAALKRRFSTFLYARDAYRIFLEFTGKFVYLYLRFSK
jgi:hypothetical protein